MSDRLEEIIDEWGGHFEPATGSRGQGGLPLPGSVIDWQLTLTKDGWKYHKTDLVKALQSYIDRLILESRIDELRLILQMKGKILVHGVILDHANFEVANKNAIDSSIVNKRLEALEAELKLKGEKI